MQEGLLALGDERLLRIAIENLLGNAWKFTSKSEGALIEVGRLPDSKVFFVRDNGVGFDSELPRLQRHGLLGMRYRVEAECGTMRLESKPGEGTLIEATLPPAPARESADDKGAGIATLPAAAEA